MTETADAADAVNAMDVTDVTDERPSPVGVVGAGVMGLGITQCLTSAGHPVVVVDTDPAALDTGPRRLRQAQRLSRLLGPGRARPAPPVRWSAALADLGEAAFVIECARERIPVKEEIFRELDRHCPPHAVLASCTSAIPISRLAEVTEEPGRVLGLHFMNPAPVTDTVEVARTARTDRRTMDRALALLAGMGKKALVVSDAPGFVSNRVLMLTLNEAATVVQEGTADAARVDEVFRDCFGHRMGPLATADLIGLDTVLDTLEVLRHCTGDPRFEPCALLTRLVAAGATGRKSGRGFHTYPAAHRAGPSTTGPDRPPTGIPL
ncbi:3-hydroxyacyl-CoA dehydrogenase family protein [Streptomyces sp. LP11]|uniref:3-hydroxyacyl-CoA dehydrogenase family protein n=1 Tax=Streptomyces pyxinicus TaxID=2970331 RepID=A0ABT2B6J2_9ACTN|nr:3-hydroxyacyl-CoA dehydrogenase family protein [Streptomyces sp. LP11]MCS0603720.1 3-hydroxyacyl-CoA dehydrogenase family protein [Streptomyces sp. LP11]